MKGFARIAVFTAFLIFAITVAAHAAPAHVAGIQEGLTALKSKAPRSRSTSPRGTRSPTACST